MKTQLLKLIKTFHSISLKFCISLSLIFTPYSAYSAESELMPADPLASLVEELKEKYENSEAPPAFQEASQALLEMGEAIEDGRLSEYISSHEELKNKFDVLSLRDQEVRIIPPHVGTQKTIEVSGDQIFGYADSETSRTYSYETSIDFNQFNYRVYPTVIKHVEVGFEEGVLAFKAVVVEGDKKREKQIGLVHLFKDIKREDVIDYAYDREMLALLHKEKGLILYHTVLAKAIMGEGPIPSMVLPIKSSFLEEEGLKLEFIDRSVKPPVKPSSDQTGSGVMWSIEGEPLYTAGDLLLSYENHEGKKTIGRIFKRSTDLNNALFSQYVFLDFLLEMALLQMNSPKDIQDVGLNRFYLEGLEEDNRIFEILSSFLNKDSLLYLHNLSHGIKPIKDLLIFSQFSSGNAGFFKVKDMFLHSKWLEDYTQLREQAPALFGQVSSPEGVHISSQQIAGELFPSGEVLNISNKEKVKQFFKKKGGTIGDISIILTAFALAIIVPTMFMEDSWNFQEGYTKGTWGNVIFLGGVLLLSTFAAAASSIKILKLLEKGLPKGRAKTKINQVIENWQSRKTVDRLVGLGFRITSYLLYPVWRRAAQFLGQPHFFEALSKGLNPFQRVRSDSSEGVQARIDQTRMLGVNWPQWSSHSERYQEQESLISAASESKKKIHFLSRLISYYVISGQEFNIQSLLTGIAPLSDKLSVFYETLSSEDSVDKKSPEIQDFFYVSHHLSHHIENSEALDKSQPVQFWDKEILKTYYEEGKALYEKAQNIGFSKKVSNAQRIANKWIREELLSWNVEKSQMLSRFHPSNTTSKIFWSHLLMDHLTIVTIPLTELTPRGDYTEINLETAGVDAGSSSSLFSSKPHFHEVFFNIVLHTIYSARIELQRLGRRESMEKQVEEYGHFYENIEQYRDPVENEQGLGEYFKHFFKPLVSFGNTLRQGTDLEEKIDFGSQLWKSQMLSYRFFQVALILGLTSRLVFTDQAFSQAFIGNLFFMAAGLVYFGWPQIYHLISNLIMDKETFELKRSIDRIALVSHRMTAQIYSSEESREQEYEGATEEFEKLYNSSKKLKKFFKKNSIEVDFSKEYFGWSVESPGEHLERILTFIREAKIPTETNKIGLSLTALITMGIFSNIAFVYLSVDSFKDLDLRDALYFLVGTFIGVYSLRIVYSNFSEPLSTYFRNKFPKDRIKRSASNFRSRCEAALTKLGRSEH